MIKKFILFSIFFVATFSALLLITKETIISSKLKEFTQVNFEYKFKAQAENRSVHRVKQAKAQIKMEPESSQLWLRLAQNLLQWGQYSKNNELVDQAYTASLKAQKLHPFSVGAVIVQAQVLLFRDLATQALERVNWVLTQSPKNYAEALGLRSRIFLKMGRLEAAESDAVLLTNTKPSLGAYAMLGEVLSEKNKIEEALEAFEKGFSLELPSEFEESLRARQRLAKILLRYGFFKKAKEVVEKLEEIERNEAETLALQAELSLQKGSLFSARAQLQASINKARGYDKRLRLIHVNRALGNILESKEQLAQLEADVRQAVRLGYYNEKKILIQILIEKRGASSLKEAQTLMASLEKASSGYLADQFKINYLKRDRSTFSIYKDINKFGPPTAEQLFMMGRLNEINNNWLRAFLFFTKAYIKDPGFKPEAYGYAAFPWANWFI